MSQKLSYQLRKAIFDMAQNNPEKSNRAIANLFGLGKDVIAKYRNQKPVDVSPVEVRVKQGEPDREDVVNGNSRTLTLNKTRIQTLEELVEACQIDLKLWNVDRFVCKKWDMGYKDAKDEGQALPLFSVSAYMSKKANVEAAMQEIDRLKEEAKQRVKPKFEKHYHADDHTGKMLEVAIFDAHFGKLAWGRETGERPYDLDITEAVYWRAFNKLLERAKGYKYDYILFPIGNDLLNSDDMEGRTTKGTYVSTDGRFHKVFSTVRRVMVQSVEILRSIAPVKVIVVPGNHDSISSWCIGDSIECWFHSCNDVTVDNLPRERKYHQHGKVMLMLTHGDKGKRADYGAIMAVEQPKMFGETKWRECHTGHLHTSKLDEKHGVRVRILASLSTADAWHSRNGFIGNLRTAEAFVWDAEEGLIAQFYYCDDAQPAITTDREVKVNAALGA